MKLSATTLFILLIRCINFAQPVSYQKYFETNMTYGYPKSIISKSNGDYLISGYILDSIFDFRPYILKISNLGNLIWSNGYKFGGSCQFFSSVESNDGSIYSCGQKIMKNDSSGNVIWVKTYNLQSNCNGLILFKIKKLDENNFLLGGMIYCNSKNKFCLMKIDSSGSARWIKGYDSSNNNINFSDFEYLDNGNIYVLGTDYDSLVTKMIVFRTDSSGNLLSNKTYRNSNDSLSLAGFKIIKDPDNNLYISGTKDTLSFGRRPFIYKLDSNLIVLNSVIILNSNPYISSDLAYEVFDDTKKNVYLIFDRVDSPTGNDRIGVVKCDSSLTILLSRSFGRNAGLSGESKILPDNGLLITGQTLSINPLIIKTDSSLHVDCNENTFTAISSNFSDNNISTQLFTNIPITYTIQTDTPIVSNLGYLSEICITDIEQQQNISDNIKIFPNPFNSILSIETEQTKKLELMLYDITGRRLVQRKFISSITINTENLAQGIYYYSINDLNFIIKNGMIIKN